MASVQRIPHNMLRRPVKPPVLTRQAPRQLLQQTTKRHASSSSTARSGSRTKIALYSTSLAVAGYLSYLYATDTRASAHQWLVPRMMRLLYPDAEDAHYAGVMSMKALYNLGMHPRERAAIGADPALALSVFGHPLANPIGISAGLDKHADVPDALFALGAGVVEVGGCTPLAQPGNPRPRMFRLPGLDGLINRFGLNSHGADDMAIRLRNRVRLYAKSVGLSEYEVLNGEAGVPPGSLKDGRLLAVQIAKNKDTPGHDVEAVSRDYTYCVSRLAPYADILVVNVSSPNTPGLRDLQAVEPLTKILTAVVGEARRANRRTKPKVMVKVSPDEDDDSQMEGVVQAVWQSGVDGVIVGNTTNRRTGIVPPKVAITAKEAATLTETGGYSGPMMFDRTLDLVKRYRKLLDGESLSAASTVQPPSPLSSESCKDIADEAVSASLAGIEGTPTGMIEDDLAPTQTRPTNVAKANQFAEQKVIFATGGITNGEQALQMLNAGASVAMVYTAMAYGGAGTITRIKGEMKNSMVPKRA
ncbi:dihydroorotate dehydrogenase [Pseudomassariella vexata]|uniref:Dihydroorotate dehydrogenase n=1 Tax=Pseudomassariella vexata TaxID=1141098 RepID=A0A1Y2DFR9_9PEZI|nr:dihydroorotate dehydrogenase [Pseudomassariella vexata]ORY58130.1 dihydroorotate dehydrogenase [Pseudomassariella vexata]